MSALQSLESIIAYLRSQLETRRAVLFTGSGFSLGAHDLDGRPLPTGPQLSDELWSLCFPGEVRDASSTLQDLFHAGQSTKPRELERVLQRRFTVDSHSLPNTYETVLSLPWKRIYTLNVDDLELAAARKFSLPREIQSVQGIARVRSDSGTEDSSKLSVIHLNGRMADGVSGVTFSTRQYAERLATQEPWYARLVSDLISLPFVFIGTPLDEQILWQHIEYRGTKGQRGLRELRPRSFLVSPSLSRARQLVLSEYNVEWIPLTLDEFSNQVLAPLKLLGTPPATRRTNQSSRSTTPPLPEVAALVAAPPPATSSLFLLGDEPSWQDIQAGRAIERSVDAGLFSASSAAIAKRQADTKKRAPLIVLAGTAGSGKSTAAMRLGMRLSAAGHVVRWIGKESDLSPRDIRLSLEADPNPFVLIVEDADQFGTELASIVRDTARLQSALLVIAVVRSSKADKVLNPVRLEDLERIEVTMPHLTDLDIGALIDVLDRENRLGQLKGKPRALQEKTFREKAGRQLVVAMVEATSGQRFEEKVVGEWRELADEARELYALVAAATALRHSLSKEDLLLALGDKSNTVLNTLDMLARRNILATTGDGRLRARHRMIADLLIDELRQHGSVLPQVYARLAFLASVQVAPQLARSSRQWRFLKSTISHSFLFNVVGLEGARMVYETIEAALSWDYHYWLQRGSLEVEAGDLRLAENFIQQARSLNPDDPFVANEYALMLFRKAIGSAHSVNARGLVDEAIRILRDLIGARGKVDKYPYHVLGSQAIAWSRRANLSRDERRTLLRSVLRDVEGGIKNHPTETDLSALHQDLLREVLGLEVVPK